MSELFLPSIALDYILNDNHIMKALIQKALADSFSYQEYRDEINVVISKGPTEKMQYSDSYAEYCNLSVGRMDRVEKTIQLQQNVIEEIKNHKKGTWMVITEGWCGDASQSVPIIDALSKVNANINLRVVLRDRHDELMENFLTNGGKSIPIVVFLDDKDEVLGHWGPRPDTAQAKVEAYKALDDDKKPPYAELSKEIQKYYNQNKGEDVQLEFVEELIVKGIV